MADVIDVVHRITYEVNESELIKATDTIKAQVDYFVRLNELMLRLQQRMAAIGNDAVLKGKLEASVGKLASKIKEHGDALATSAEKSKVWQHAIKQELDLLGRASVGYEKLHTNRPATNGGTLSVLKSFAGGFSAVSKTVQLVTGFVDTIDDAINKLDSLTKEYAKQQTALTGLDNSLRNFNQEPYFEDLTFQAQYLSDTLGYLNNDEILKAQEALVQYGKLGGEQIQKLTTIIVDYAANQHISVQDATRVFIDGLNGQTDAFKKINVSIKQGGDVAQNYKQIITEVFTKVNGSAQAFGSTTEGQISKLKTLFADFKEKIGEGIAYVLFGPPEKIKSQQQLLEETRISFNAQMDALKSGNLPLEARKMLIDEINTKYATYLPKLLTEKSSLQEIEKAQYAANRALLQHILYLDYKEKIQSIVKKKYDGLKSQAQSSVDSANLARNGVFAYNKLNPRNNYSPSEVKQYKALNQLSIDLGKKFGEKAINEAETELIEADILFEQLAKQLGTSLQGLAKLFDRSTNDVSKPTGNGTVRGSRTAKSKPLRKENINFLTSRGPDLLSVEELKIDAEPIDIEAKNKADKKKKEEEQKELAAKRKQQILDAIADYQTLAQAVADAYNTIVQVQINALDKEIAIREKRVDAAQKLAEKGNVEALRIEEERLQKAQQMREQFARRQQAVNAAITVSNAIAAVARAALEGGGFGSVATIAALLAALAAGYAAVTSMSNDNAYADGVVDFRGKGGPRDDANWVRISSGESVITAEGTRNNRHLLEAINDGAKLQFMNPTLAYTMPTFASPQYSTQGYASTYDLKVVESKLDGVINAIEDNRMKQNIYFNEHGVGIMTERAIRKDRKKWM